jgi:hypothetical protein
MKIYSLYLKTKNNVYAITDNIEFMKRFISERNSNLFKVTTLKCDKNEGLKLLNDNSKNVLNIIPLEDINGDYEIIGTIEEDNIINRVCERMAETCNYLKSNFIENVPFNDEYKALLNALTTISKDIDYHPIIQIDSVKLFYYLFKETFTECEEAEFENETYDILNMYKE